MPDELQAGPSPDATVDVEVRACLSLASPRSFFLFAGAGSGKTHSLIEALKSISETVGPELRRSGRGVGVITYTNSACDEIERRIRADKLFAVSTIHSFAWSLIDGHFSDIRASLQARLSQELREIAAAEDKGRKGTKASNDRLRQLAEKTRRLQLLPGLKRFVYNPTGSNTEENALTHAEVIALAAEYISGRVAMQKILAARFPFILVDESQDTSRLIVEALIRYEAAMRGRVCVGFFGDTMQRIYGDGMPNFPDAVPAHWAKPTKQMNYRSPRRVVALINKIRELGDKQSQLARRDAPEGFVRLFVAPSSLEDKPGFEAQARATMAKLAGDEKWLEREQCKVLVLEHHMAAKRLGFESVFRSISAVDRTGVLEGTFPAVRLLSKVVFPLVDARRDKDDFRVSAIARADVLSLSRDSFREAKDPRALLKQAKASIDELCDLCDAESVTCGAVFRQIAKDKLFALDGRVEVALAAAADTSAEGGEALGVETRAMIDFLDAPLAEARRLIEYVEERSAFDTHHNVKGLEFDRVMGVMDDADARGFLFSYDKLLGGTPAGAPSSSGESSIDRTRRLFYVICSRAKSSLALVAYTADAERLIRSVAGDGLLQPDEIERFAG